MTTNQPELKACREAFEKWFFPTRKDYRSNGISLDENDANSMWMGWEAAWNARQQRGEVMTLFKAINAAREVLSRHKGRANPYQERLDVALAALPDKPKSEEEILNIISQECWKKEPMIPQRIFEALKAANVLYVEKE